MASSVFPHQTPGVTETRLATVDDLLPLARTVTSAFDQDPAFRAFFVGPRFDEMAEAFATDLLARRITTESVWTNADCSAVAMWDPPVTAEPRPESSLMLPDDARERLDAYDAEVHAAITTEPHWYLGVLASRPELRGRGLARLVAEPGLAAAAAAGVPAVLETTNSANVAMYERSGWSVTAELPDVIGLTVWVMEYSGERAQ